MDHRSVYDGRPIGVERLAGNENPKPAAVVSNREAWLPAFLLLFDDDRPRLPMSTLMVRMLARMHRANSLSARSSATTRSMTCEKKITRAYKAKLTKEQLKTFRSLMWEFRRDPETLTVRERFGLQKLFKDLPDLGILYRFRIRFKEIFDTAPDRDTACAG